MKFLLAFSLLGMVFACQKEGTEQAIAEVKLQHGDKDSQTTTPGDWRYAKYKFSLAGHKDVLTALRVEINADNEAIKLELKDLTAGREARQVEIADLSGEVSTDSITYDFNGTSALEEGDVDYGGTYTGSLTLNDDRTVADDGCCGEITFKSKAGEQADEVLTFMGEKVDEAFGETEWNTAVGTSSPIPELSKEECVDFKLVFSELKDVEREEKFDFTVSLQSCDDNPVTTAEEQEVTLYYTHDGTSNWYESELKVRKIDAAGHSSYEGTSFKVGQHNQRWEGVKYKASVQFDHDNDPTTELKTYTAESNKYTLSPATDIAGSCSNNEYKLVVSKQPTNVKVKEGYTMEVTLKCDGVVVSDIKQDRAANAPVTKLQFKIGDGEFKDSNHIKGVLGAGIRTFKPFYPSPVTLTYKIGVTINDTEYTVKTDPFNVTEAPGS